MVNRPIVIALLLGAILLCVAAAAAGFVVCQADIPMTTVDTQPIAEFVGTSSTAVPDLLDAARNAVAQNLDAAAEAHVGFVLASYICEERACQPLQYNFEILITRMIDCPVPGMQDRPGEMMMTNFVFDFTDDSVRASSDPIARIALPPIAWDALPIDIDRAITIAFEAAGDTFAQEHDPFRLTLALQHEYWSVRFNSDLTGQQASEVHLAIDLATGEIRSPEL